MGRGSIFFFLIQQKQAIVNQVVEGSTKRLGKDDFQLDMNLKLMEISRTRKLI